MGKYPQYKVVEVNKNNKQQMKKMDILPQLISDYYGETRVIEYREDLHKFLLSLDDTISEMVKKIISFFTLDTEKFIQNFEQTDFKLLTDGK